MRVRRSRHRGALFGVLLAYGVSTAVADVPNDDPPPAADTSGSTAPPTDVPSAGVGHAKRPIVVGLIAAGFLLFAGLAGANDRPRGDPPKP